MKMGLARSQGSGPLVLGFCFLCRPFFGQAMWFDPNSRLRGQDGESLMVA